MWVVCGGFLLSAGTVQAQSKYQQMSPPKREATVHCRQKGLKPGSEEYKTCMRGFHSMQIKRKQAWSNSAKKQEATQHCAEKGLTLGTPEFRKCMAGYRRMR